MRNMNNTDNNSNTFKLGGVIRNGEHNGQWVKLFEFVNKRGEAYKVFICGPYFMAYRMEPHYLLELDCTGVTRFANWLAEVVNLERED